MDPLFLRELLVVSLTYGDSQDFIADFPEPRPSLEHAKIWSDNWRAQIVEKATEAMKRKNCAVSYIQFVADQHGFLVSLCFKHTLMLGDAKRAAKVLFKCLPDEATCRATQTGLRPLDEVDTDRIRAWQTMETLRPKGKKLTREESDDKTQCYALSSRGKSWCRRRQSRPIRRLQNYWQSCRTRATTKKKCHRRV